MKFITARHLAAGVCALLVATSACQRAASPNANLRSLTNASRHRVYVPTEHDLISARATMLAIAHAAKRYFRSEQRYTEHEPWHPLKDPGHQGLPVAWDDYTFPGGPGFVMTSLAATPQGGEMSVIQTQYSHDWFEHVRYHLGDAWPRGPSRFKYSYIVGPGSADDAILTIIAEANFDPSTPTRYTMKLALEIDPETAEIVIYPIELIPKHP